MTATRSGAREEHEYRHRPVKAVNIIICERCLVRWPCRAFQESIAQQAKPAVAPPDKPAEADRRRLVVASARAALGVVA